MGALVSDKYFSLNLPITEPHSDHFFFKVQRIWDNLQLFTCRFRILIKSSFKSNSDIGLNRGTFLSTPPNSIKWIMTAMIGILTTKMTTSILSINNLQNIFSWNTELIWFCHFKKYLLQAIWQAKVWVCTYSWMKG